MTDESETAAATAVRLSGTEAPIGDARFAPGVVLGDRFRIVALLGRGGMGEVYRAEDLKMGQQVALKFVPDELSRDRAKLDRLFAEVRLGRQVAHPNVCRIYDVVECDGHTFVEMEYIDGEDLAALLRRIGRLPQDKALAVAHDVAAGLAAAHALGIVHRDLKPANIMLDARGTGRITDFGLAVVADEARTRNEVAGTPAYMAPEQLASGEATYRSDLYALGALLYELFTGRRLFDGRSVEAIRAAQSSGVQSAVRKTTDVPVAIQKLIAKCLEPDPARRPASIHAFIATLPGRDPLQAALDAGETPSPEMVAAAGDSGELRPAVAWPLLMITLVLIAIAYVMSSRAGFSSAIALPLSREALQFRAQELLQSIAKVPPPRDAFGRFILRTDALTQRIPFAKSTEGVLRLRPVAASLYYRQSPGQMFASGQNMERTDTDPPFNRPGMAEASLDPEGRLVRFAVVGPEVAPKLHATVDWSAAFDAAGVERTSIRPAEPSFTPPVGSDQRFAWDATLVDQPAVRMHVEAAALAGRPVWFEIMPPWKKPASEAVHVSSIGEIFTQSFGIIAQLLVLIAGGVLARRNLLAGRADVKLATRLAILATMLIAFGILLHMDHTTVFSAEYGLLLSGLGQAIVIGVLVWAAYVALEPYLRRRWPRSLIAWKRLFDGRINDPMVGREVLIGLMLTSIFVILRAAPYVFWPLRQSSWRIQPQAAALEGPLHFFELLFAGVAFLAFLALVCAFLLLLAHIILRNRTAAIFGAVLLGSVVLARGPLTNPFAAAVALLSSALITVTIARRGILTAAVAMLGIILILSPPVTLDPGAWFFWRGAVFAAMTVFAAIWAFVVSVGAQPLFSGAVLED